jgi:hypothetical protein
MNPAWSVLCLLISSGAQVFGATHYVDLNSLSPSPPYTSWPTAATTIQEGVDAASAGDEILVANGLYTAGGKAVGGITNRVAIDKAVTVRSVHGPQFTLISGSGVPGSVRCVYLANGARLSGFTLTNGLASAGIAPSGGGLWCETTNAIASNCVVVGNGAYYAGGGVSGGTLFNSIIISNFTPVLGRGLTGLGGGAYNSILNNCLIMGNQSGTNGGGVFGGALNNCTVTSNAAPQGNFGGGVSDAVEVRNSIIYFNTPNNGSGHNNTYSCTTPDPGGVGNITSAPLFLDLPGGNVRLQSNSPCINAGNNAYVTTTTDLDAKPRIIAGMVDIGAYEFGSSVRYVDADSPAPVPPYASWNTAAVTIQDAVDAASAGDEIVVTNGIYASGGRAIYGTMTNRVAVDRPVILRSVNGPQLTIIQGYQVPGSTNGDGAIRCVSLTNGATLIGFTLTNGATRATNDYVLYLESTGGGVWCQANEAVVSNCVIVGNSAYRAGGGFYAGTLYDSTLRGNTAANGGGAADGVLIRCILTANSAQNGGGACYSEFPKQCRLYDCLLLSNYAVWGGGAFGCKLTNCTLVANAATSQAGGVGGFTVPAVSRLSELYNCIVHSNTAPTGPNYDDNYCFFDHSSTSPQPAWQGTGNITDDPRFVALSSGNLRLQSNSPCINAGYNPYVITATDLDGSPRISGGTVDMGAYEFQGPAGLTGFHAWLAQYGLPADGSADYTDSDADGMNNWQEWRASTNPTNAASLLRIVSLSPAGSNVMLTWQSVLGAGYSLETTTNLAATIFSTLQTNLAGQQTITTFVDTNAAVNSRIFYRVRVQ